MFNRSYINSHLGHPHHLPDSKIKHLMEKVYLNRSDDNFITIIKHLSDPTKFKIYLLLNKTKEISVSSISEALDISQSTTSHALSDLKKIGLVKSFRCGQLICYSLTDKNKSISSYFIKFIKSLEV